MFVPYDGGLILVWRHNQKRTTADADAISMDEVCDVNAITAARHPVLARILASANKDGRLFPDVNAEKMNAFIRAHVPGTPPGFDVRAHGLRTGADADADTLTMPDNLTRALFWWKRQKTDMRSYYSAVNLRLMFLFTERRSAVILQPILPGAMDAAVTDASALDWSTPVRSSLPTPPDMDTLLKAATAVSPSFILTRRLRGTARAERARRALGAGPTPDLPSGEAPVLEGYCALCFRRVGPEDKAAACMACNELACQQCVVDTDTDWRCPGHREPTRFQARRGRK
jgi:hypothetical protein